MRPPAVAAHATKFWLRRTNVCHKITSSQIMGADTMKGSALRDVEREGLNRRFDPLCQLVPAVNGRGNCPRASRHPAINVNGSHTLGLA